MAKRDIRDYLRDILYYIAAAERLTTGKTFGEFEHDETVVFALARVVEIIGEATKQIPIPLREQYPGIAWKQLVGMRDRLAHVYFSIDLVVLWDAVQQDLPLLKPVIESMLEQLESTGADE
ncbi:MAG: DUF86 domain-containing protein [Cyanobacteria bacterium P01_D01_bin.14]